mmetsp:Transcript_6759/g.19461  ORF Transcript_6759/g.19461 Transcript_6759/m.19461 type:complete len:222 (+) Transcript_6759:1561-2226(+)
MDGPAQQLHTGIASMSTQSRAVASQLASRNLCAQAAVHTGRRGACPLRLGPPAVHAGCSVGARRPSLGVGRAVVPDCNDSCGTVRRLVVGGRLITASRTFLLTLAKAIAAAAQLRCRPRGKLKRNCSDNSCMCQTSQPGLNPSSISRLPGCNRPQTVHSSILLPCLPAEVSRVAACGICAAVGSIPAHRRWRRTMDGMAHQPVQGQRRIGGVHAPIVLPLP